MANGPKAGSNKHSSCNGSTRSSWPYRPLWPVYLVSTALIIHLQELILGAQYNSLPLDLHRGWIWGIQLLPALIASAARGNGTLWKGVWASGGYMAVVGGRRMGYLSGRLLGPEYGAMMSQLILSLGVLLGCAGLARLEATAKRDTRSLVTTAVSSVLSIAAILLGRYLCSAVIQTQGWITLIQRPERWITVITSTVSLVSSVYRLSAHSSRASPIDNIRDKTKAAPKKRKPAQIVHSSKTSTPLLELVSPFVHLVILASALLRSEVVWPNAPYAANNDTLNILSSERGVTGQIVVGDDMARAYRYLRSDGGLIGGRWVRYVDQGPGRGMRVDLGDSIFSTFYQQEFGVLAHRSDAGDSVQTSLRIMTEGEVDLPSRSPRDKTQITRAAIFGLGAGISAQTFANRGYELDLVELDPLVYRAAVQHYNLRLRPGSSVNLVDVISYVEQLAATDTEVERAKWSYVVHDLYAGGTLPIGAYTLDFWTRVAELTETDGIVSVNVFGLQGSEITKSVLRTLLAVFSQCRVFSDGEEASSAGVELFNTVFICTMAYSPILSFRAPTEADNQGSPLRTHIYETMLTNEIPVDSLLTEQELSSTELVLHLGHRGLERDQIKTSLASWHAMQKIFSLAMWLNW